MKKKAKLILLLGLVISTMTLNTHAADLPGKAQVLKKMKLANDYFMKKWPDPTIEIVTNKTRPSNIWTRATYYEGLIALYRIEPDSAYYKYAVDWAEGHNWDTAAYGRPGNRNADDQCCGQTYIELYQIDPKPQRIEKIKATIDQMVNDEKK